MTITVKLDDMRKAWGASKKQFVADSEFTSRWWINRATFFEDFGNANGMHVIIDGMQAGIPEITRVEFGSEESYAWFLLRWS